MIEKTMKVTAPGGFHVRPASEMARIAKSFSRTKISITSDKKTVSASSMLGLLSLGLKEGSEVVITADGPAESDAIVALAPLFTVK